MKTRLTPDTWPEVDAFPTKFAASKRWGADMETRLLLIARSDGNAAGLEFIATTDTTNIEGHLVMPSEASASVPVESETPCRLLLHYASSIRHQQCHDIDVLTIRVDSGRTAQAGTEPLVVVASDRRQGNCLP